MTDEFDYLKLFSSDPDLLEAARAQEAIAKFNLEGPHGAQQAQFSGDQTLAEQFDDLSEWLGDLE